MSLIPKSIRRRYTLAKAYGDVFNSPDGQVVLIDIMQRAGVLASETGDFHVGRRSLALEIMEQVRFDEGKLLELANRQLADDPDEG